ncbi:hypothetical protein ACSFB8_04730 [Enterococcus faecalis]
MRKTAKNMGNLSKSGKYDDSEIPKSSVFVADSISVDEETNGTKITNMRMEV